MKKSRYVLITACITLLLIGTVSALAAEISPVYFDERPTPAMPEVAITQSHNPEMRVPMYAEASAEAQLLAEYFNGVSVAILEHVSDEWVLVDIRTFGTGGYGYMMAQDLVWGDESMQVEKTTLLYTASAGPFIFSTRSMGQGGDMGPYEAGVQVELLGIAVSESSGMERPLLQELGTWHVKIGEETGFLPSYDALEMLTTE